MHDVMDDGGLQESSRLHIVQGLAGQRMLVLTAVDRRNASAVAPHDVPASNAFVAYGLKYVGSTNHLTQIHLCHISSGPHNARVPGAVLLLILQQCAE